MRKLSDVDPSATISPLPQLSVNPTLAPGKRGPAGMSSRVNYARVNTGTPTPPDTTIAAAQKMVPPRGAEMLPKVAEELMTTQTNRPLLQDMVKAAMASAASRVDVVAAAAEARQEPISKVASVVEDDYSTANIEKIAAALEYVANQIKTATPGEGAGALKVTEARSGTQGALPSGQGKAHHAAPLAAQMQDEHSPKTNDVKKTASDILARLKAAAEGEGDDATIKSRGAGDHPVVSSALQPGGEPVAGAPRGPTSLIDSNESARNYTRAQAYANRKADLSPYLSEPALTSATDKTLQQAFEHTSAAGPKIASECPECGDKPCKGCTDKAKNSDKTASARALLARLANKAGA